MSLPCNFQGVVVRGTGRGEKQLGFPTANLDEIDSVSQDLDIGVYYGLAKIEDKVYGAAITIGSNPKSPNKKKTIKVCLVGFPGGDLVGKNLEGKILGYIRNLPSFETQDDLKKAISNDMKTAERETAEKLNEMH